MEGTLVAPGLCSQNQNRARLARIQQLIDFSKDGQNIGDELARFPSHPKRHHGRPLYRRARQAGQMGRLLQPDDIAEKRALVVDPGSTGGLPALNFQFIKQLCGGSFTERSSVSLSKAV